MKTDQFLEFKQHFITPLMAILWANVAVINYFDNSLSYFWKYGRFHHDKYNNFLTSEHSSLPFHNQKSLQIQPSLNDFFAECHTKIEAVFANQNLEVESYSPGSHLHHLKKYT
jgi:hypothetical protein